MDNPGPTLMREMLSRELKRLREQSGLGADDAARALGCARTRISHLETGRNPPARADLEILCPLYGVPDQAENLLLMLESASAREQWPVRGMAAVTKRYFGFEESAATMRRSSLEAIPGILQSPDYARAMMRFYEASAKEIESHVEIRERRWRRVLDGKMTVTAIISEGALARVSYLGQTGYCQLELLLTKMDIPGVSLQVLPHSTGPYYGMTASFTILTFPEGSLDPVVLHDRTWDCALLTDYTEVVQVEDVYQKMEAEALDKDGTTEKITEYIEDAKEIVDAFP